MSASTMATNGASARMIFAYAAQKLVTHTASQLVFAIGSTA